MHLNNINDKQTTLSAKQFTAILRIEPKWLK